MAEHWYKTTKISPLASFSLINVKVDVMILQVHQWLHPYTAEKRDLLGCTSQTTKRFPEAQEMSRVWSPKKYDGRSKTKVHCQSPVCRQTSSNLLRAKKTENTEQWPNLIENILVSLLVRIDGCLFAIDGWGLEVLMAMAGRVIGTPLMSSYIDPTAAPCNRC